MILGIDDIIILKDLSIKAAKDAGSIIMRYKKRGFDIFNKNVGSSPAAQALTEVDLLCQKRILELLEPYINKYDLGLLTEEEEDNSSRLIKDYFFSIDPMDGTKSFIESTEGFSVSISLINKLGESVLGVVYDPVKNNLYTAIKGKGLYKNSRKWSPKFREDDGKLKILVDPSFKQLAVNNVDFVEYGGAVLNAIEVLEGRADCYIKKPKKQLGGGSIWDFSSTVILFNECGEISEDLFGKPIFLNNPETTFMNKYGIIFCSNSMIKQRIIKYLEL